jgi:hypothetical protein
VDRGFAGPELVDGQRVKTKKMFTVRMFTNVCKQSIPNQIFFSFSLFLVEEGQMRRGRG